MNLEEENIDNILQYSFEFNKVRYYLIGASLSEWYINCELPVKIDGYFYRVGIWIEGYPPTPKDFYKTNESSNTYLLGIRIGKEELNSYRVYIPAIVTLSTISFATSEEEAIKKVFNEYKFREEDIVDIYLQKDILKPKGLNLFTKPNAELIED